MKFTVEVDCTPVEAREFLGLPDVQPMQEAIMKKLQDQMASNMDQVSLEALMKNWFDPTMAENFRTMFVNMTGMGVPTKTKK